MHEEELEKLRDQKELIFNNPRNIDSYFKWYSTTHDPASAVIFRLSEQKSNMGKQRILF
jgi:hypothetical protein